MKSFYLKERLKLTSLLHKIVTFKDLKKRVSLETTQQQSRLTEILHNKSFWIWDIQEHKHEDIITKGDCCFNHIIGLPQRNSCWVQSLTLRHYLLDLATFMNQNSQPNSDHKRRRSWL
ncbi:MAG: hypothetical protein ACJ71O_04955 [Nitrososphaeraceae archaeon]|jgi:hypothetical protein